MTPDEVQQMIDQTLKGSFTQKRIGDTPTDGYQLTPKKYVDNQIIGYSSVVGTLTNKRITMRVGSIVSGTSPVINTDLYDAYSILKLGANTTIDVSGKPTDFQKLIVRVKDDGTSRTLTWTSSFTEYGSSLPSVTTVSSVLTVGFLYNITPSIWGCVAVQEQ